MSRLLIFSLNYSPEPTGFAPHTTALAEHLVKAGHDVTVITGFPFAPRWARWPEYRGELVRHEVTNGVRVARVTHFIPGKPGRALQRILMEGTFAGSAALEVLLGRIRAGRRFEAVVYVGAQPAIAWLARIVASVWRVPYIVKITDLAAQAAVDVGIVARGGLAAALKRFEFSAYRQARWPSFCAAFKTARVTDGFADAVRIETRSTSNLPEPLKGSVSRASRNCVGVRRPLCRQPGPQARPPDVVDAASTGGRMPGCGGARGRGETRDALAARIAAAGIDDRVILLPLQPEEGLANVRGRRRLAPASQVGQGHRHPFEAADGMATGPVGSGRREYLSQAAGSFATRWRRHVAVIREPRHGARRPSRPSDRAAMAAAAAVRRTALRQRDDRRRAAKSSSVIAGRTAS